MIINKNGLFPFLISIPGFSKFCRVWWSLSSSSSELHSSLLKIKLIWWICPFFGLWVLFFCLFLFSPLFFPLLLFLLSSLHLSSHLSLKYTVLTTHIDHWVLSSPALTGILFIIICYKRWQVLHAVLYDGPRWPTLLIITIIAITSIY